MASVQNQGDERVTGPAHGRVLRRLRVAGRAPHTTTAKRRTQRALAVCTGLAITLLCTTASASDADPWFGPDKALHFGASVALSVGGYAASSIWLDTRTERALAGGAFSLTLGAGKELWDLGGHGDPSWRDFTWDVIGTGVGIALAVAGDALLHPEPDASLHASRQGLVIRF